MSQFIGLERLVDKANIQILELGLGKPKQVDSVPFVCEINESDLALALPFYALVQVKEGWRWTTVHDGRKWNALGTRSSGNELPFTFPSSAEIKISLQGRTWLVRRRPVTLEPVRFELASTLRRSKYFGLSLFGHINLFLILWLAVQGYLGFESAKQAETNEQKKTAVAPPPPAEGAAGGGAPSIPFAGITYTEYSRRVEAAKREADPLGYLTKSLSKMKNDGAGSARISGAASATGNVGSGLGKAGSRLSDVVAGQKFEMPSTTKDGKSISEKQRLALHDKFKDMQEDFQRVYNRLLGQDPKLSVTVTYQTRVQPSGYLELADFKAHGTYQPESLAQLKKGMADVIRGVFVGPELNGLAVRADTIFAR